MYDVAFITGSFNPPHLGHAKLFDYVVRNLALRLQVYPHSRNLQKNGRLIPFEDRVEMLKALISEANLTDVVIIQEIEQGVPIESTAYDEFLGSLSPTKNIIRVVGHDVYKKDYERYGNPFCDLAIHTRGYPEITQLKDGCISIPTLSVISSSQVLSAPLDEYPLLVGQSVSQYIFNNNVGLK
tara:strand:+ start:24241 stop:24789 length:549 start_codon:yes stop_codon:yes gene_type:complete